MSHRNILFKRALQYRSSGHLIDVSLFIRGRVIHAHRFILSAHSPYFYEYLADLSCYDFELSDIDYDTTELLINFMYTGEIDINEVNVKQILLGANRLLIDEILRLCFVFLKRQITVENCLGIKKFVSQCDKKEALMEYIKYFINENFNALIERDEIMNLPFEELNEIISDNRCSIEKNENFFKTCMEWCKKDINSRKIHLLDIMKNFKLDRMSNDFLIKIRQEPLLKENLECRELIEEATDVKLATSSEGDVSKSFPDVQGQYEYVFIAGGYKTTSFKEPCSSVEYFHQETESQSIEPMSSKRGDFTLSYFNGSLYAIGGYDGKEKFQTIERYDFTQKAWINDIPPIDIPFSAASASNLAGYIYISGGFCNRTVSKNLKRYNQMNEWSHMAPMHEERWGHSLVTLGYSLYVIGGSSDDNTYSNSVERYDPVEDKWTQLASMNYERRLFGCAVLNNMIYVAGGLSHRIYLSSVERYDPANDTWTLIASLNCSRGGCALSVLNNTLYVFGGSDRNHLLDCVEVYNEEKNEWVISDRKMTTPRRRFAIVSIKTTTKLF